MYDKVGIVHWVEGAGHAARALPVAKELEARGVEVAMAGGGPGRTFVELNGYDTPGLPEIDFSDNMRDPAISLAGVAKRLLTEDAPSLFRRYRELRAWIQAEEPDTLLTDDPFAMVAAVREGVPFSRIDHVLPAYLQPLERIAASVYNRLSLVFGDTIYVTSLWDIGERDGYTGVGPLAQEGEADVEPFDVLIIPGSWSTGFDELRERLEENGLTVRTVGDEDWETAPAMTPYTGAADCVVCTGYSSIADSVVAGTPCVVYPFMRIQKVLAQEIAARDLDGIEVVHTVDDAASAVAALVAGDEHPEYENGAPALVDDLLTG